MAETRAKAAAAFDAFIESYQLKYEKAAACLAKDHMRCSSSTNSPRRRHP